MAAAYLRGKGYAIVGRRLRYRHGELDIVARDGVEWVFVEVKTRTGGRMGTAAEAMTKRKAGRMGKAIKQYVDEHLLHNSPLRCDLIAIDYPPGSEPVLSHYPGGIEL